MLGNVRWPLLRTRRCDDRRPQAIGGCFLGTQDLTSRLSSARSGASVALVEQAGSRPARPLRVRIESLLHFDASRNERRRQRMRPSGGSAGAGRCSSSALPAGAPRSPKAPARPAGGHPRPAGASPRRARSRDRGRRAHRGPHPRARRRRAAVGRGAAALRRWNSRRGVPRRGDGSPPPPAGCAYRGSLSTPRAKSPRPHRSRDPHRPADARTPSTAFSCHLRRVESGLGARPRPRPTLAP